MADSAKSRSKTNPNIANEGLLDEQENVVDYTVRIDLDMMYELAGGGPAGADELDENAPARTFRIARGVARMLESKRPPDQLHLDVFTNLRGDGRLQEEDDAFELLQPVHKPRDGKKWFDKGPKDALRKWILWNKLNLKLSGGILTDKMVGSVKRYKSLQRSARPAGEYSGPDITFRSGSSVDPHTRQRSTSHIFYASKPDADVIAKARRAARKRYGRLRGQQLEDAISRDPRCSSASKKYLGHVDFFFTFEPHDGHDPIGLAYIRHMAVVRELYKATPGVLAAMRSGSGGEGAMLDEDERVYASANLFRLSNDVEDGAHEVVRIEDIIGLAGLIKGDENTVYVVDSNGALWLNLGEEEDREDM